MRGAVAGTIPAVRGYLSELALEAFATASRPSFAAQYRLAKAEDYFEVSFDSITGARLVQESGEPLPPWTTVSGLDPQTNPEYQAAAAILAAQDGVAKVHLDVLWSGKRD